MLVLICALIVSAAIVWAGRQIADTGRTPPTDVTGERALRLLELFAPALAGAARDVREILVWQPLALAARRMFPDDFASLDRASGTTFPFGSEQLEAAHARWTAEWLAWEHRHDVEYKLKAAVVEQEMSTAGASPLVRARFDAIEREKLELYQRRYEEYIRIAKALQTLIA